MPSPARLSPRSPAAAVGGGGRRGPPWGAIFTALLLALVGAFAWFQSVWSAAMGGRAGGGVGGAAAGAGAGGHPLRTAASAPGRLATDGWCAHAARLSDAAAPATTNDFARALKRLSGLGVGCMDLDAVPTNRSGGGGGGARRRGGGGGWGWAIGHPRDLAAAGAPELACSLSHLSRLLANHFALPPARGPGGAPNPGRESGTSLRLLTLEPKVGGLPGAGPGSAVEAVRALAAELRREDLSRLVALVLPPELANASAAVAPRAGARGAASPLRGIRLALPVRDDTGCAPLGGASPPAAAAALAPYAVAMPSVGCWGRDDVRAALAAWQGAAPAPPLDGDATHAGRLVSVWVVDDMGTAVAVAGAHAPPGGDRAAHPQPLLISNRVDALLLGANSFE